MTPPPLILDLITGTAITGGMVCAYLARPRPKPPAESDAAKLMRLDARWRSLKAARKRHVHAWEEYRNFKAELMARSGKGLATGWRGR